MTEEKKSATSVKLDKLEIIESELLKELNELALEVNQSNLILRLNKLATEATITESALFAFLNIKREKSESFLVTADSINQLGKNLYVSSNAVTKNLSTELFRLSADRGDGNGASNLALQLSIGQNGVEKNLDDALYYIDFAIRKNVNRSFITKAKILFEKNEFKGAIDSVNSYFIHIKDNNYNKENLDVVENQILNFTKFLKEEIKKNENNIDVLNHIFSHAELLLSYKNDNCRKEANSLKNKCYYAMGLFYLNSGNYQSAMLNFIQIPKDDPHYKQSTSLKKECYLKTAEVILSIEDNPSPPRKIIEEKKEINKEEKGIEPTSITKDARFIRLPDGGGGILSFGEAWKKDKKLAVYDIVDTSLLKKIKNGWQEILNSSFNVVHARKAVTENLKKMFSLEYLKAPEILSERNENIKKEEEALDAYQLKLNEAEASHTPINRRKLRRAKTEAHYFDPTKTKSEKKKEVWGLYQEILAARFAEPLLPEVKSASPPPSEPVKPGASPLDEKNLESKEKTSTIETSSTSSMPAVKATEVSEPEKIEKKEVKKEQGVISLDGRNARQIYRAERLFQQAGIHLLSSAKVGSYAMRLGIPRNSEAIPGSPGFDDGGAGPIEFWQSGKYRTKIVHRVTPSRERLGNILLTEYGNYDSFLKYLNEISRSVVAHEKQLAAYMIRYGRTFEPATLEELQKINPEATEQMAERFHDICLLVTVKEQTQWLSSENEQYRTGLAVAQARCLILLREGFLNFEQIFKKEAEFGIFSQVDLLKDFKNVESIIQKIEELYMGYIKFNKSREHTSFFISHPNHEMVLTRQQARLDLREVYGGEESDLDSEEGYESDISYSSGP